MRSEEKMMSLILSVAQEDERIRAVILNGSRTNKQVTKDDFQDFDVIYLVKDLASFKDDLNWIDVFGERIIMQMPNSMKIDDADVESTKEEITYLMLFKDFNRIDLNLIDLKNKANCQDSLNKILLDKDNLFGPASEPSDQDYWIKKPSPKEFIDCCNEFWWVSTYVIKGLARVEPLYAKSMLEGPVRNMFMKMIAWSVGTETDFSVNLGNSNRFLKKQVSPKIWTRIMKTYPDAKIVNIWHSLIEMTDLFHELGLKVADNMGFVYNTIEAENVKAYMKSRAHRIIK